MATSQPHSLPERIDALTSVRFFAAFWVLLLHITNQVHLPGLNGSHFIENGDFGVDLFFTLSGFILCHVYLGAVEAGRFNYLGFIWARFARIWPVHALMTIVCVAIVAYFGARGWTEEGIWGRYIVANLTMTHSWGFFDGPMGLNGPSWSVSAEWGAYLAFGLFAAVTVALRARPWTFVVLAAALLAMVQAYLLHAGLGPLSDQWFATAFLRIGPEFLLGCALYGLARATTVSRAAADAGAIGCALATLVAACLGEFDLLMIYLLGAMIYFLAQRAKHPGKTVMSDRRLIWLGEASYSLYLVHDPVLGLFYAPTRGALELGKDYRFPLDATLLLALLAVAAATWACFELVEKPARNALRRLGPPGPAWVKALARKTA